MEDQLAEFKAQVEFLSCAMQTQTESLRLKEEQLEQCLSQVQLLKEHIRFLENNKIKNANSEETFNSSNYGIIE